MKLNRFVCMMAVLGLFSVAAMPRPMTAEFRAGTLADCTNTVSSPTCPSIGADDCKKTYVKCAGGDKKTVRDNCKDGAGNQADGCDGAGDCGTKSHATRETNCEPEA